MPSVGLCSALNDPAYLRAIPDRPSKHAQVSQYLANDVSFHSAHETLLSCGTIQFHLKVMTMHLRALKTAAQLYYVHSCKKQPSQSHHQTSHQICQDCPLVRWFLFCARTWEVICTLALIFYSNIFQAHLDLLDCPHTHPGGYSQWQSQTVARQEEKCRAPTTNQNTYIVTCQEIGFTDRPNSKSSFQKQNTPNN